MIFYLLRTGAQWRMLPHEDPPRYTVFYHEAPAGAQGRLARSGDPNSPRCQASPG
ncbi:transposase [Microvirga massiliensis]|uniref:transposase n=1 Tax=Microvirga massiliensis TaxID=1033741 RepID=UPI003CC7D95A